MTEICYLLKEEKTELLYPPSVFQFPKMIYIQRRITRRFLFTLLEVIPHDLCLSRRLHRLLHQFCMRFGSGTEQKASNQL